MATILVVTILFTSAVIVWHTLDRVNQHAVDIKLLLDGIIDRLNKLERYNRIKRNK